MIRNLLQQNVGVVAAAVILELGNQIVMRWDRHIEIKFQFMNKAVVGERFTSNQEGLLRLINNL